MREFWISLNSINGLGPVRIQRLIEFCGSPKNALETAPRLLVEKKLIPQSCAAGWKVSELLDNAHEQLDFCNKNGITVITQTDEHYPSYLKEIFAPPPVLYVKGDLSVFGNISLAIVGTRNPTSYGVNCTRGLTARLSGKLAVTSGLARGIDTIAHECCIETGGKTIAVLGCGIDRVYPAENKTLAARICRNGALVSEFPPGTPPDTYNFPRRNRVISGISCGVLVVEAGEKSGALITANYALQQNRTIFAVPGPINSPLSKGTFRLIKDGAIPVSNPDDIFDHISSVSTVSLFAPVTQAANITPPGLDEEELSVLDTLSGEPIRIDTIAEVSGKQIPHLLGILLNLELKGVVTQISGQQFRRAL
ncbi:MAG: DNA-processing protein DprA [Chitinispirillales bacterium]|jgi:DNA processing protein|nr:DNA-processing protein DprA [Chitinispirillales bacterium]